MRPSRPRDLPEFRLWLHKQWQPGELFWQVAQVTRRQRRIPGENFLAIEATFDDRAVEHAPLYWVSAEMSQLISQAAKTLPPTTLTEELVPSPTGLVWFEEPLLGLAAQDDADFGDGLEALTHEISITAIVWGESMIPPGPHAAIGLSGYSEFNGLLAPAGRTDWDWGVDSDAPITAIIKDDSQRVESMAEDRRWVATFWLLLSQPGISETSSVPAQPRVIRKAKRAMPGITADELMVRVINVHKPAAARAEPGEGRAVNWSHRWIVNPHWRQQAYGPNRSLRRPTLIGPYVKGPTDKALKIKDTVHVLKDGKL